MNEITGRIIRTYNGYYYVESTSGELLTCKVKGKLKKERFSIVTGDLVVVEEEGSEGMVSRVLPRRNYLQRPMVANIDLVLVCSALVEPDFIPLLTDKLLCLAEYAHIPVAICLNKADLAGAECSEKWRSVYSSLGYPVYIISAKEGRGIAEIRTAVRGKIAVFAGPSGVGKSTTLNAIDPSFTLRTGSISEKIRRGKHTTRYAQLLPFAGGYIADTPGFGNLNLEDYTLTNIEELFPEFREYAPSCHFRSCKHLSEPECKVKEALSEGKIAPSRYESYVAIAEEWRQVEERKRRR